MRRFVFFLLALTLGASLRAADKEILLIAGPPSLSHGPGQHEHNAGLLLLQKCLAGVPGLKTEVSLDGWPRDPAAFAGVDAIIISCNGGPGHLALQDDRPRLLDAALARGAGLGLIHWALEPDPEKGESEFLRWVGGCFELDWSVNPQWTPSFSPFPRHPIVRGVRPFSLLDEWTYHLRFAPEMRGVTPLLVATPDASTLVRPDGPRSGNPTVRAALARGEPQTLAWAFERPDGGRGFGFAGGHYHQNWANDDFRKLVLNAIVWLAKIDVPANGIDSSVSAADLAANLDHKPPRKPKKTGAAPVTVTVDAPAPGATIPADFIGLSFESASERPNANGVSGYFFDPANTQVVTLFRQLGVKNLRLGGATVDRSRLAIPDGTDIDHVFAFARAAGLKVIYSFRLQRGDRAADAALAGYIWQRYRSQVVCFAIGNEVDWHAYHTYPGHPMDPRIYETEPGVPGSAYPSFLATWREFAAAIAEAAPGARFEGPSTGSNYPIPGAKNTGYKGKSWTVNFANDEKGSGSIAFVAQHSYVGQDAVGHTVPQMIDAMLSTSWVTKFYPALYDSMVPVVRADGFGYRFMESNSYSEAVPGGSNSFATALWALDYLHWWAARDCLGVNFHNFQWRENDTIYRDSSGNFNLYPMGYGIKAFDLGSHGTVESVALSNPDGVNLTAYAVRGPKDLFVTLINKDHGAGARAAKVSLSTAGAAGPAAAMFLAAPRDDVAATTGVTLGGAPIDNHGLWLGQWTSLPSDEAGPRAVLVPAGSAAIVKISLR